MTEKQYKLPDVGEGLTEAEIIRWYVRPGEEVGINQTVVEIETAKAAVELPSPYEGVVRSLLVEEGQTVDVGTPIITVDVVAEEGQGEGEGEGEATAEPTEPATEPAAEPAAEPPDSERQPVLVGYGVRNRAAKRRPRKMASTPSPSPAQRQGRRVAVLAKPPVRKLAKDLGVDLSTVEGTGPHGTISRADVEAVASGTGADAALAAPAYAPAPTEADPRREERIPVRGVRKRTAEAMVASAFTAPHVTEFLQIDATATADAAERIAALPEYADVRVSPLLLAAKALLVAVRRHPIINSTWDEDAKEIVVKHYVNLGVAVASQRGLVVPNVKDAHTMALPQLAQAMQKLVDAARAGKSTPGDMQGGTITVNNVGVFGVDGGTPLLNPGEAAILALGQIRDMPWVVDGQVVPRKVTTLSLSFDHRVIDGELGSKVLRDVGRMLEDPTTTLAWT